MERSGLVMDWIQRNRYIVASVGIAALLVIVGVVIDGDDEGESVAFDPEATVADTTPATTPEAQPADGVADADRPDVEQVDCRILLTTEEIDAALGTEASLIQFNRGETCVDALADDDRFFVRTEPGAPGDLTAGTAVDGIWDDARWMVQEGGGTLAIAQDTALGVLIFKVTVGRPDAADVVVRDAAAQLATAALPRFPGVEVEEPTPEPATIERPEADRSGVDLVSNLLAREARGDWTLGGGLVATLQLLVGEREPDEVLVQGAVVSQSATGVVALAADYVEAGDDESLRPELQRLLGELVLPPQEIARILQPPAPPTTVEATTGGRMLAHVPGMHESAHSVGMDVPGPIAQEGCALSWYGIVCGELTDGDGYSIFGPEEPDGGWDEDHIQWAKAAAEKVAQELKQFGDLPDMMIVLSPKGLKAGEVYLQTDESGLNVIYLSPDTVELGMAEFQQTLAGQMAIAFIEENLDASQTFEAANFQWWAEGLAVYWSAVLFEDGNREYLIAEYLAANDTGLPLTDRGISAAFFFAFLHNFVDPDTGEPLGLEGVLQLLVDNPNLVDHGLFDDAWHQFNQMLADGRIRDTDGSFNEIRFLSDGIDLAASQGRYLLFDAMFPHSVIRLTLDVPAGQTCTVTVEANGVRASHRPRFGPVGTWLPGFPSTMGLDVVVVITTTDAGGQYSLDVECEDTPSSGSAAEGVECLIELLCEKSGFYYPPGAIRSN